MLDNNSVHLLKEFRELLDRDDYLVDSLSSLLRELLNVLDLDIFDNELLRLGKECRVRLN